MRLSLLLFILANQTGADIKPVINDMEKRTYESAMWQHDSLPLCVAAWSDNNIVKTLSNFHSPVISEGLKRRQMNEEGTRNKNPSAVDAPAQQVDYCETFHQIDKSNGKDAKFVLGRHGSKTHGWTPKISFRFFNMTMTNAFIIYEVIFGRIHKNDPHLNRHLQVLAMLCVIIFFKKDQA